MEKEQPEQPLELAEYSVIVTEKLLLDKITQVESQQWSEALREAIQQHLLAHQIDDLKVYRVTKSQDFMLCIQGAIPDLNGLDNVYVPRSRLLKIMPALAMLWAIFAFTALIARDLSAMMSAEFLIGVPFVIGALMQYVFSYEQMNSTGEMSSQQVGVLALIVFMSLFVIGEGIICVIMASPLLYLWQMCGAVMMRVICNSLWTPTPKVYSLSAIPLLLILINPFAANTTYSTTKNEILIDAPASQVFAAINNIQDIKEEEIQDSPIFWMGFPKPTSGMTVADGEGFTRQIHWQRGIYFEEKITHSEPDQLLAWTYRFTPESFPKGSLDDHVEIGGEYFDLATTDYRLEAINPHQTKLILTIDYRLSTELNWYAKPWANYVLNEFSDVVLNIYKNRLENQS